MADDRKSLELQIKIATQEAVKAVSSLKGEVKALCDEAKKYAGDGGESLKKSFKEAEAAAKEASFSIGDIKKAVSSLAEVAAALKALSVIKDMGSFALKTADDFQTMRNQFGILLGDMQAGAGLFNEIKAFNDKTPFDMSTLTQATNVLIAAKVPLQDLQEQLRKFGDLSQGNSQKMTSYVNAFSQAAAKGKADMQVLNTYLNQGVPILDALAKNFNVTAAEIVEMSSKGQIGFNDFSRALDDLTSAGGRYFGGMELASESLAAMQEGLRESVNSLAASFGEMLMPAALWVTEALTGLANLIDEHPIAKGVFAAALITVTGLLAAKAVQATIAFAAQMSLNLAIGALNPVVLATTIAVAGLAAGYTVMAADAQKAAREAENLSWEQKKQTNDINASTEAVKELTAALRNMSDVQLDFTIGSIKKEIDEINKSIKDTLVDTFKAMAEGNQNRAIFWAEFLGREIEMLGISTAALNDALGIVQARQTDWIDSMFSGTKEGRIQKITEQLEKAREYAGNFSPDSDRWMQLQYIIQNLTADLERMANNGMDEINRKAAQWKDSWADFLKRNEAAESFNPFAMIDYEREKTLADAHNNYIRSANQKTLDEINTYYDAEKGKVIRQLADEEARLQRELNRTRIGDLEYERDEAIRAIQSIGALRVSAAASDEEIAEIRDGIARMLADTGLKFQIEIDKAAFDEAREAVKDWQGELSDSLALALMNIKDFSAQAAVVIGDLSAQLIALSANAALSGFTEFGRALGEAEKTSDALSRALAEMSRQILNQLPMMFMQAGLQLIANGQWALGLGFIAAAGSSAVIAGFTEGASKHAQGGAFDECGQAAREFAAGGAFTNQIVGQPTYFKYGGSLGVMGEAGPEAVMPLKRMPSGNLGVETSGSGNTNVIVNVINYSGAEVRQEESTDGGGNKQIDVIIGQMINNHIASGKADRSMGRYGLRAMGV